MEVHVPVHTVRHELLPTNPVRHTSTSYSILSSTTHHVELSTEVSSTSTWAPAKTLRVDPSVVHLFNTLGGRDSHTFIVKEVWIVVEPGAARACDATGTWKFLNDAESRE